MEAIATLEKLRMAPAPVVVRAFEPRDAPAWDDFVARCPDATFFHRIGWRSIIEDIFRHRCHYLIAERGGNCSGVLPLAETRSRLFGHALTSLPFAVYGGPAADDLESQRALIDAAVDLAQSLGVEHLELRNAESKCPGWPRQDLYVTFRKTMLADAEANMLAIPAQAAGDGAQGHQAPAAQRDRRRCRAILPAVRGQHASPWNPAVLARLLRAPARGLRRRLRGDDGRRRGWRAGERGA